MLKALDLGHRTLLCTCLSIAFFYISRMNFVVALTVLNCLILINSVGLQYAVIHSVMKMFFTTPRGRLLFLAGTSSLAALVLAGISFTYPDIHSLQSSVGAEEFENEQAYWGGIFVLFSGMLVALSCARRAFARHGALG